jgi:hypothetical protein
MPATSSARGDGASERRVFLFRWDAWHSFPIHGSHARLSAAFTQFSPVWRLPHANRSDRATPQASDARVGQSSANQTNEENNHAQ